MKAKLLFVMINLIIVCFTLSGQDTISIADNRDANASPPKTTVTNKDKDVVISRITIPDHDGNFYYINMYRMDNGKLRMYPFGTSASGDYDKATYKWTNDTTIVFKLINTSNNKSESFRMSGNGNRSDLERK
jgi:hypothetical protein